MQEGAKKPADALGHSLQTAAIAEGRTFHIIDVRRCLDVVQKTIFRQEFSPPAERRRDAAPHVSVSMPMSEACPPLERPQLAAWLPTREPGGERHAVMILLTA
jgi:hypothetical protein